MDDLHSIGYWLGHFLSGTAVVGALLGVFPAVAACVALIFYIIQIFESSTVKTYFCTRRLRKIIKLKAKLVALEGNVAVDIATSLPPKSTPEK